MVCLPQVVTLADETIEKLIYELEAKVDKAIAGFDKVEKSINDVDKKMDKSSKAMEKGAQLAARAWQLVVVAITAAAAMMVKFAASSSMSMETYITKMTNLYGSVDIMREKMKWLYDFAKNTPFELSEVIEGAAGLKSAGIDFQGYIESLGDAAAALPGKTLNDAIQMISDAQMGQFERLAEFGLKAIDVTGKNWEQLGVTQAEIGKTVIAYTTKEGQEAIKTVERTNKASIRNAIRDIFSEVYGGGMEAQSETATGIWSNIKGAVSQAANAFMGLDKATMSFREGSLFNRMKGGLQGLLDTLNNIDFEGAGKGIETFLSWMDKGWGYIQPWIDLEKKLGSAILGIVKDISEGLGTKAEADLGGLKLLAQDLYTAFLMVRAGVVALFEFADAHDLGKYLAYPLRLTAEAASLTYIAIRDRLVKALDFLIEKYNSLVPMLQKAGVDAEVISMDMFKPLENSAKTAREEVKKEMDQMAADQKAAVDEMTGAAKSADIIPGKRASYAQIMGVDAAAAAGLSGVYGSAGMPAANVSTTRMPAAQPLAQSASGPTQTGQQQQVSKYTEILKQMIESTNSIIKTLQEEPRKADINIKMDIETSMDVKKFERTTIQAVSDGVRGKAKVV